MARRPQTSTIQEGSNSNSIPLETIGATPAMQTTEPDLGNIKKLKEQQGWRKVVRNFTPSWFASTMGTGILSILLHNFQFPNVFTHYASLALFCLNILLFTTFTLISLIRYSVYPEIWRAMIRHPAQSLFLGCWPMGLATIVNMVVFVCVPKWGVGFLKLAQGLWWIDAAAAIACCFYMPFVVISTHHPSLPTITAALLLPIVAPIVTSASGSILALSLLENNHPQTSLVILITSYVLLGTGLPLALTVLVIYFQRLALYSLPPKEVIVSVFLPLGPLGQGGFAIMNLGKVAMALFPITNTLLLSPTSTTINSGDILYVFGWVSATIMWGFALFFLSLALLSITRAKFPFNMGWWGFTFPLGVFTSSTVQMGVELPSQFFKVLGSIFTVAVGILWIVVGGGTLLRVWTGEIFVAPCLKDLAAREAARGIAEVEEGRRCQSAVPPCGGR